MIIDKFLDPNALNQAHQVQKNKNDIAELENQIKEWYNTQNDLTTATTTIALSDTNIGTATTGFLLSKNALLFKIVAVEEQIVYLNYWASLPQGEQGIQGETGATGNGIQSITKTGTSGFVDTYQILFTNGSIYNFTVTNGESFNYMGFWIDDNEYYRNDVVKYDGNLYILIVDNLENSNVPPSQDLTNWALFLPKGQNGADGSGINPNILINGDFSINQRGQDSYIGTSGINYGVDRWCFAYSTGTVFNYLTKTISSNISGAMNQYIEKETSDKLLGKTVTLSTKIENIIYSSKIIIPNIFETTPNNIYIGGFAVSSQFSVALYYSNIRKCIYVSLAFNTTSEVSYVIEYVKLELGSVATANSPNSVEEELSNCQRFFQIRSSSYTFSTNSMDRTPVMRVNGTVGTTIIEGTSYNTCDAEIY